MAFSEGIIMREYLVKKNQIVALRQAKEQLAFIHTFLKDKFQKMHNALQYCHLFERKVEIL